MSEEENQTDSTENGAGENATDVPNTEVESEEPSNQISESDKPDTAEIIAKSISGKDVNIDALLKVPVSLAIEVGRTKLNLNDLLGTREGSVIELDRHLDEPLDILINGALIAHGIVVLANEKFGLQITDIISLEERARSL
jgi:flagellar motor switch protein FliN/FliY